MNSEFKRQPIILAGHGPTCSVAVERLLEKISTPQDTLFCTGKILISDIRRVQKFVSLRSSNLTVCRAIVFDMRMCPATHQAALLNCVEENTLVQFIFSTNNVSTIIDTLRSRCRELIFKPEEDFGSKIKYLQESGIPERELAASVESIDRGYSPDSMPRQRDRDLITILGRAANISDYEAMFDVFESSTDSTISAIREKLLLGMDEELFSTYEESYPELIIANILKGVC